MNYIGFRTDLALEATEIFKGSTRSAETNYPPGVSVDEIGDENIRINRVKISSDEGEKAIGKPRGNYITLEIPALRDDNFEMYDQACRAVAKELRGVMGSEKRGTVLIVGLGNWNITPDALGPKVVSQIIVTRHFLKHGAANLDPELAVLPQVCAVSPGVLGITGIETFEIVKGIVDRVDPSIIVIIDSLASRKTERINTTIQIADTGIAPGSGVGNRRMALSRETLGRPVIAIGVPTVIDAATLAGDAMAMLVEDMRNKNVQLPEELSWLLEWNNRKNVDTNNLNDSEQNKQMSPSSRPLGDILQNLISPYYGSLIVTPKEIDEVIKRVSSVIADGINISLGTQRH